MIVQDSNASNNVCGDKSSDDVRLSVIGTSEKRSNVTARNMRGRVV
jgi:hypothetical protein